jgi:hypothetical protein
MSLLCIRTILLLLWGLSTLIHVSVGVRALSSSPSALSDVLQTKFHKLRTALSSPSGKLTISPELYIPEPKDATSILLLTNSVQIVSERIRCCKSNVVFVRGSITALQTLTNEQASAMGNFPGPVPTVYCYKNNNNVNAPDITFLDIATAGADGVLIDVCPDNVDEDDETTQEQQSIQQLVLSHSNVWMPLWQAAIDAGIQPIPEIRIGETLATRISDDDMQTVISTFTETVGTEPVAVVVTIGQASREEDGPITTIPNIPKVLSKHIPIIGSVRASSDGENRLLLDETIRYKDAGYTGTFLRYDCIPGYQLQPNLEFIGKFWFACISDLKSTRSKSFSFRSKNRMEVSVATKWGNYQKDVIESGALGDPNDTASFNDAGGDYQGFA